MLNLVDEKLSGILPPSQSHMRHLKRTIEGGMVDIETIKHTLVHQWCPDYFRASHVQNLKDTSVFSIVFEGHE